MPTASSMASCPCPHCGTQRLPGFLRCMGCGRAHAIPVRPAAEPRDLPAQPWSPARWLKRLNLSSRA